MPIPWGTVEAKDQLFLATVAACDPKLDYRRIATFYGQGATYDAIEGQFRKIRKGAKELKARVESGEIPSAPPRGAKTNPNTPRKPAIIPKDRTATGRVSKSTNATPTKKGGSFTRTIKEENESSASSLYDSQSQLESASEEVADWTVGLDAAFGRGSAGAPRGSIEGVDFDFGYGQLSMEEGV